MQRQYRFWFENGEQKLEIETSGVTPCAAKAQAFDLLEQLLEHYDVNQRQGWQLIKQRPYINGVLFDC